jgi:signal transduction histidine kinase
MDDFEALLSQFEATAEESAPKEEAPKPTILVVDDDPSIRRALGRVFADRYDVLTAESGSQGVEILSETVHCVILDVKMKEENGFTAYPKLKAKSPDVPIIFYTAFQSEHDLQGVINKCKPEGYVDKGQDIAFLTNLIGNAVNKYQLIIENKAYKEDLEKKVEERTAQLMTQKDEAEKQRDRSERLLLELKGAQEQIIELQTRKRQDKFLRASAHDIKNKVNPISDYGKVIKKYADFMPRLLDITNTLIQRLIENANTPLSEELLETKFLPLINEIDMFFERNSPDRAIKAMDGLEKSLEGTFRRIEIIRNEGKRRDPNAGYMRGSSIIRISDLMAEIEKDYEERMRQHGIRFVKKGDEQACLKGEWQHFYDIFSNIVDNGLRHIVRAAEEDAENEKTFEIEIRKSDAQLSILLSDTGTGMSEEEKEGKIFDPFYTTNVGPGGEEIGWGTGMGIVSDYVDLYEGTIEVVRSEQGKGTTFAVSLPATT